MGGDAEAQAQLRQMAVALGEALSNPVDTVSRSVKGELALAEWLDSQRRHDEATQVRAKLAANSTLTVTGMGMLAVKGGRLSGDGRDGQALMSMRWRPRRCGEVMRNL